MWFEAAQLDLLERKLDLLHVLGDHHVVDGFCVKAVRADRHHLIIGQIDGSRRVFDDGGGVRGKDVLAVADAQDQEAASFGADQDVGEIQAGGFDLNQHLSGFWMGCGQLFPVQGINSGGVFAKPGVHKSVPHQ